MLAKKLAKYSRRDDVIVLGLPRGGAPVAFEVASKLHAPLDVFPVRKLGVPGHEELAMGAVATGGIMILNQDVVDDFKIRKKQIEAVAVEQRKEMARQQRLYRGRRPAPDLHNRIVVLVDDGLATGATMRAAISAVKRQRPSRTIVAVPVGVNETCDEFGALVDEIVCIETPEPFFSVGFWYDDFSQTTDQEVQDLLCITTTRKQLSKN